LLIVVFSSETNSTLFDLPNPIFPAAAFLDGRNSLPSDGAFLETAGRLCGKRALQKQEKVYRQRHPERTPFYSVLFHHFDRFVGQYDLRFEKHYGAWRPVIARVWKNIWIVEFSRMALRASGVRIVRTSFCCRFLVSAEGFAPRALPNGLYCGASLYALKSLRIVHTGIWSFLFPKCFESSFYIIASY
jgi:hypothetical protein